MILLIYDTEMQTANAYLPNAITAAAHKLLGISNVHFCCHMDVVEHASSGKWDGLLAIGGAGADLHIMTALMEIPILKILWTTEDPYERRLIKNAEPVFHHIFSNEESCDGINPKTSFLPLAAEPDIHFRNLLKTDDCYDFDLTFVGTAWPNRVASLERILALLPDSMNVFLCLPWNRHIPQPRLQKIGIIPQLRMDINDLCDIWNRSRIVLTIGREFSLGSDGENEIRGISPPPRIYETALAGGCQIVLGGRHFELPGKYSDLIQVANDEQEASKLIKQYLVKPRDRIFNAMKAQEYTLQSHIYSNRLETIIQKFRDLESEQNIFISQKTNQHIFSPASKSSKPTSVLHVAHNLIGFERAGGTELYVDSIAIWQELLCPGRIVLSMAPKDDKHLAVMAYKNGHPELVSKLSTGPITPFASSHTQYEQEFCKIISKYKIGLVHFHHLKGLPLSLPIFARALGCRVVVTLHDFYMLCHRYTLLRPNDSFCEIHKYPDYRHLCNICLKSSGLESDSRNRRLEISRRSMFAVDRILGSTASSVDIARQVFPEQSDQFEILEMVTPQIELLQRGRSKTPRNASSEGPLSVAIIGNAVRHKGLSTLVEVLGASRGIPLEFHIFGATDELDEYLKIANISSTDAPIKTYTYGYEKSTLVNALNQIDVALFLSTWPETYHISLGEAMYLGVVPIATNLGAHSDRIQHEINGLLVPPNDSQAVIQMLLKLNTNRCLLDSLRNAAMDVQLMSIDEHGKKLEQIYSDLEPRNFTNPTNVELSLNSQLTLAALGVRLNHERWNEKSLDWDDPA